MDSITIEPIVSIRSETNLPNPKPTQWKSCCFTINTSATKYFVQVSILASLIVYSATMLVIIPECNSQRKYCSLLLFCLGILTPTPKMWMRRKFLIIRNLQISKALELFFFVYIGIPISVYWWRYNERC